MALRLPGVSGLPPYVMGIGFRPAKLRPELIAEESASDSARLIGCERRWLAAGQGDLVLYCQGLKVLIGRITASITPRSLVAA